MNRDSSISDAFKKKLQQSDSAFINLNDLLSGQFKLKGSEPKIPLTNGSDKYSSSGLSDKEDFLPSSTHVSNRNSTFIDNVTKFMVQLKSRSPNNLDSNADILSNSIQTFSGKVVTSNQIMDIMSGKKRQEYT